MQNPESNSKPIKNAPPSESKIRQFQWYEVQSKMRQLMSQILHPFNKKQTQQTLKINELKRTVAQLLKVQQSHSFLLQQQNAQKPKYIELQDTKISQLENKVKQINLQMNSRMQTMQNTVHAYQTKTKQINQLQARLDQEIKNRIKEFQQYTTQMNANIDISLNQIQTQNQAINNIRITTRNTLSKFESKIIAHDSRFREVQNQIKRLTNNITKLSQDLVSNFEKITEIQLKNNDLDSRLNKREKDELQSQKFHHLVKDIREQFKFVVNYLEKYQPLYIQMQISETLNSFAKGRQKRKICLYEEQKFASLHQDILNQTHLNLSKKMTQFTHRIRTIMIRNKKYIMHLKVQKSIKVGQNIYDIRLQDEIPEQDIQTKKKEEEPIDYLKLIQEKWKTLLPRVQETIKQRIHPTIIWMKQLQEQFLLTAVKENKRLEEIDKKIQAQAAQFTIFHKNQQSYQKNIQKTITQSQNINIPLLQSLKQIINFGSIINHLIIQDEIDRQGLALYAYKGNTSFGSQKIVPTVQLDTKCLTCSNSNGSTSLINQAFKMACLSYSPSLITMDQQTFTRQETLEISTQILDQIKIKLQGISKDVITDVKDGKNGKKVKNASQAHFFKQPHRSISLKVSKTIDLKSKQIQPLLPIIKHAQNSKKIGHKSFLN